MNTQQDGLSKQKLHQILTGNTKEVKNFLRSWEVLKNKYPHLKREQKYIDKILEAIELSRAKILFACVSIFILILLSSNTIKLPIPEIWVDILLTLEIVGIVFLTYYLMLISPVGKYLPFYRLIFHDYQYEIEEELEPGEDIFNQKFTAFEKSLTDANQEDLRCYRCNKPVTLDELLKVDKKIEKLPESQFVRVAEEFIHVSGEKCVFHSEGVANVCETCLREILK